MQTFKNPAMPPVIERSWQVRKYTCLKAKAGVFIMAEPKNKIHYKKGDKINGVEYLYELPPIKWTRIAMFKCPECGKDFKARIGNVRCGQSLGCGCGRKRSHFKHGLRNHPLFLRWCNIIRRCYSEKHPKYNDYGGRGIKVYKPWITDFKSFYDYVTNLPGYDLNLTIDREDNNKGYEPNNLRWVSRSVQTRNRRKLKSNKTGYIGVMMCYRKFRAQIGVNGESIYLGSFNTAKDASDARRKYIEENNLIGYNYE